MFNLWKTFKSKSSLCKILLRFSLIFLIFTSFVSCDGIRARLSSKEVKPSFQFWIWRGSSFLSITSEEGFKRLIEDKSSFQISLTDPVLWDLLENNIYWSVAQEGLYSFPSHSPHLIRKFDSYLINYFFKNKIANHLVKLSDRIILFFSINEEKEEDRNAFQGLNALSITTEGIIEPFFFPFFKNHLLASLLQVRVPFPNQILTEWRQDSEYFYLDFDIHTGKEKLISSKKYRNSFSIIPSYNLRASYQEVLNIVAYHESLDSFLVEVFNQEQDYTYFIRKGTISSQEEIIFKAYETPNYLSILVEDRVYDLDKNTVKVKTVDLPRFGGLLNYEKVIPSDQGFWVSWNAVSSLDSSQKIVGLLRVPYAR